MKRIWILIAAGLLGSGLAWGQYGYQYMSGGYWFGAQFIGQEGWMVGAGGAILHTSDGGMNWVFQRNIEGLDVANPPFFTGVEFKNSQLGWACSNTPNMPGVYVWKTTDGGLFWQPETLSSFRGFPSKLTFPDTFHGWIACGHSTPWWSGGSILATTNGGRTWANQDSSHAWFGAYAVNPQHCWVAGESGWTGRTTDGGATWMIQQIPSIKTLYDVFFSDTLYGWACGDSGTMMQTRDGGLTWASRASGTIRELLSVRFLDRSQGFVAGDSGMLLRTSDGGATWLPINTGVSRDLAKITFGDSLHGWIIGKGGTTLETSDGGLTWQVTRQGTTERIQGVSFVDDQTGWVCTWEGNIWGTQDGGSVWTKQTSVSPGRLMGLAFANASKGWAVGDSGRVLATQNGGANWMPQTSGTQRVLQDVFTSDAQHAWACGQGRAVFQTSNGGSVWDSISASITLPDSGISGLASWDTLLGWALFKDGNVWATTNSGKNWRSQGKIGNTGWQHVAFVDSVWGWAVGNHGVVRTTDGGRSWQSQDTLFRMKDIVGWNRLKAWTVGDGGRILATTDGGTTWLPQGSPITRNLFSVSFADSLHGIAGGEGNLLLVTHNGGAMWDSVQGSGGGIRDVFLIDSIYGWLVGIDGDVRRTTDGGLIWDANITKPNLIAVEFANRDTGWIAQQYPNILRTTNGGISWDTSVVIQYPREISDFRLLNGRIGWCGIDRYDGKSRPLEVTFDWGNTWLATGPVKVPYLNFTTGSPLNSTVGCFVGSSNEVLRTYPDLTWDLNPMMVDSLGNPQFYASFWSLDFANSGTGWAAGRCGASAVTTDEGMSWSLQKIDSGAAAVDSLLTSVQAFDGLTARATGYLGRSVLTTDGGTTWNSEETGTKEWLLASSFLSPTLGWVAGENGMVLKYGRLPYGVEEEKGKPTMPLVTSLGQNRPNPFPERTEILYQLANKGKVRLVVYNVLGQAVRRVVEKDQEPGFYAVSWDGKDEAGRNVSSGVYFYRLESSGKSLTRKMVKIR